jgi:hypothetical protein
MTSRRVLGFFGLGAVVAVGVSLAILFWYYRPSIEYAYVDVLDSGPGYSPMVRPISIGVLLIAIAAAIWWWRHRRG